MVLPYYYRNYCNYFNYCNYYIVFFFIFKKSLYKKKQKINYNIIKKFVLFKFLL